MQSEVMKCPANHGVTNNKDCCMLPWFFISYGIVVSNIVNLISFDDIVTDTEYKYVEKSVSKLRKYDEYFI